MLTHYRDYYWKKGLPIGVDPIECGYKIVTDPYRKRISIEKYDSGKYLETIYDSSYLDFRTLNPATHTAWEKEAISPTESLLRDENDRLVFREQYTFQDNRCVECIVTTPFGLVVSKHRMINEPFSGVILYDRNDHPVMYKCYLVDPSTQEFNDLLLEEWEMPEPNKNLIEEICQKLHFLPMK